MRNVDVNVSKIINEFDFDGRIIDFVTYGNGHINDTYLVRVYNGASANKEYILQRINNNVFKSPEQVMKNIDDVTSYLREYIIKNGGDPDRETLTVIKTVKGQPFYISEDGSYWRAYNFITDAICLDLPRDKNDFYQSAVAFGDFQRRLKDYPAEKLYETIPDFHNTPKRYEAFLKAIEENLSGRAALVEKEIEFVKSRKAFMSVLEDAYRDGVLPKKVTHNDTKINNVMLDKETSKPVCVIDLDTIMPGYSVTDFGDSIRFGASTALEDEKDLSKVHFSIELFETYTKGFLEGCGGTLTEGEILLLPEGAKMMTLECGMRFLTDYLNGDTYFKTSYDDHNLVRSRTQFKLVEEMEQNWDAMKEIINNNR